MTVFLFILFFLTTTLLAFVLTYLLYNPITFPEQIKDITNKCGLTVIAAIFIGWSAFQLSANITEWPYSAFLFGLFPFLISAVGLSLYSIQKGKIHRFWVYLFITLLSTPFLPDNMLIFQGYLPFILDRLLVAVLWAAFMHIYATMDKIDGMTIIQTETLCLGFTCLPFFYFYLYPISFAAYPLLIIAALIGFIRYKKKFPYLLLGKTGAAPLGYLMGLFLILMAGKGMWLSVFIMPAYYYFEILYSAFYRFIHRKQPEPIIFSFFISHVIRNHLNAVGIMPFIMRRMFILTFLGILFVNYQPEYVIAILAGTFIVFVDMINKLENWGEPKPRLRDLFSDIKNGTKTMIATTKKDIQEYKRRK